VQGCDLDVFFGTFLLSSKHAV